MEGTKYDQIGAGYDGTRRADPRIAERLTALMLQPQAASDARYLDVGCGTGNYTVLLAAAGLRMVGIDQSKRMLDAARAKSPEIQWHQGDVLALPFPDRTFAGAVCTNAIHHFADQIGAALAEMARVLTCDARLVIMTSTPQQMQQYWLNEYFPCALRRSIAQMRSVDEIGAALRAVGLRLIVTESYEVPRDPIDLFLYCGKHHPEIYLDQMVRQGISTFATLADAGELAKGLTRLREDIQSGRIHDIMSHYAVETEVGDYVFVVAKRIGAWQASDRNQPGIRLDRR